MFRAMKVVMNEYEDVKTIYYIICLNPAKVG